MIKKLSQKVAFVLLALVFASSVPFGFGCDTGGKTPGGKDPAATYTITFVTDTEQEIEPITGKAGSPVSAPTAPVREGFSFGGWLLDGAPYSFTVMPTKNIELSAKWNQIFRITFDTLGGPAVQPIDAAESEQIFAPADPVLLNHKFGGWFEGEERFFFTTMPARDVKLTAKWAEMVTISFDTGVIGLDVNPIREVPGTPVSAPPAPERPEYLFMGWLDAQDKDFVFSVMPDNDIKLTARWITGVTISFDTGVPGLSVESLRGVPGASVKAPKEPVRSDGMAFDGWLLDGEPYKFSTLPTRDITLFAKWVPGATIKFNTGVAGLTVPDLVAIPGKAISAPDVPLRANFHLDAWYNGTKLFVFNVMPSAGVTLTAAWVQATKLPAIRMTLRDADGTIIPITDSRFGPEPWNAQYHQYSDIKRDFIRYTPCHYEVSDNADLKNAVSVSGEIKPKGNGSFRTNPNQRRPYRIKFDDKKSVFGWPKSRHYVLISASWNAPDPSRLVAHSAFSMANSEVLSNLEYGARTKPIDFYMNGVYRGVYIFAEVVRVQEGRVDIDSEVSGNTAPYNTDTGYLLYYGNEMHTQNLEDRRANFNVNGFPQTFLIESPDPDDIDDATVPEVTANGYSAQRTFIQTATKNFIDSMNAANFETLKTLADIDSWVDGYILQELYRNTDVSSAGFYLYKKSSAQGGKFYAGPPWDFDQTIGGEVLNNGAWSGIAIGTGNNQFLVRLYNIPAFRALVTARWKAISGNVKAFINARFYEYMNDPAFQSAMERGAGGDVNSQYRNDSWKSNAESKRSWLEKRIGWLDGEWK